MTNAQALTSITLTGGWSFKQADDTSQDAWLPVKEVPTNVHLDLIDHGRYTGISNMPSEYS
jgi:beta-mannosidase